MPQDSLIVTLALAMVAALVGGAIALLLRQSVIIGYILGGILISPFTPGYVADVRQVQTLAEVGVVLLMFSVGVQLSLPDLLRVRGVAIVGGVVQVLIIIGLGVAFALILGWGLVEALFLGSILSNSSSTVLAKVLTDRGEEDTVQGHIGIGWSTVQDLGTVLIIVILTGLAAGEGDFLSVLMAGLKAAVFVVAMFFVGSRLLPWMLDRVAQTGSREFFILSVAVVSIGTAYTATFFGISLALGAFLAGLVISGSDLSSHILGELTPVRDLFATLFFVSVGMLVDPTAVGLNLNVVLALLAIIVAGKLVVSAVITLFSGYPLRQSLLVGAGLAQCAEFSFVLATIGLGLGVIAPVHFTLILAGAVLSVLLVPALYGGADRVARRFEGLIFPGIYPGEEDRVEGLDLRGHAVICGGGRVGLTIAILLRRRNLGLAIIEQDRHRAQELRRMGLTTLYGNAANQRLLKVAGVERARTLVIAIGDPIDTRQIVANAREINPRLNVIARTRSTTERDQLLRSGVSEAVIGEQEIALELLRHTLHRFGVSGPEIQAIIQRMRAEPEERLPTLP